jgi:hypothetical protein
VGDHLEGRREALDVQLADEELRDGLGQVEVGVGPAGHLQPVQRIEVGQGVAQRLQDPREGQVAGGQGAGRAFAEVDRTSNLTPCASGRVRP